jgi:hypothetical protein
VRFYLKEPDVAMSLVALISDIEGERMEGIGKRIVVQVWPRKNHQTLLEK